MLDENLLSNDLNKVFIPCRTVLEMESLTSLYLATSNYDKIKLIPESQPSSQQLIDIFGVKGNVAHEMIIDFFINVAIEKLKPIVMYARDHHDRYRMSNVVPYTKTRVCLFFALHRLKVKFLIIKNFIQEFKIYDCELDFFFDNSYEGERTLLSALYKYYVKKNKSNLKTMLHKEKVSERVKSLMEHKDSITNEKLLEMATYTFYSEDENIVKFIMREIKASIFVCNLMYAKLDVKNPFIRGKDIQIDEEVLMVSNDFIPEILPAMSKCVAESNYYILFELFPAFDFMMDKVLDGINNAIEIASGGQIKIDVNETLYNTGGIF